MTDAELTALIWALIACGHAEEALFQAEKAKSLYELHPDERRKMLLHALQVTAALVYTTAQNAEHELNRGHYPTVFTYAQQAYFSLVQVRETARLMDDDDSNTTANRL